MKLEYKKLLTEAVTLEGRIAECYSLFYNYSFGNQILAQMQVGATPINTYKGWQSLGRQVKKGAKAVELCMPVTIRDKDDPEDKGRTVFVFRRNWFGMNQTEGKEYAMPEVPGFDQEKILACLKIEQVPFESTNGNVQGYATGRKLALNPLAADPFKTLLHEVAHIALGHTEAISFEAGQRNIREVEAESVAYILSSIWRKGVDLAESRGYIQGWLGDGTITDEVAKRIFKGVDTILRANKATNEA